LFGTTSGSGIRGNIGVDGFGNPSVNLSRAGFTDNAVVQWVGGLPQLTLNGNNIVRVRQTGPGNPSFTTIADAQTWCQNLYNALKPTGHGLLT
jgi:hypothetical protein